MKVIVVYLVSTLVRAYQWILESVQVSRSKHNSENVHVLHARLRLWSHWLLKVGLFHREVFFNIYTSAFLKFYKNLVSVWGTSFWHPGQLFHWGKLTGFSVRYSALKTYCLSELLNLFSRQSLGLKIAVGNTAILFSVTGGKSHGPSAV